MIPRARENSEVVIYPEPCIHWMTKMPNQHGMTLRPSDHRFAEGGSTDINIYSRKKIYIHIIPYHIPSIFHPSPINNHKSSPKVSLRRCSLPSKPSLPSFGSTLPVVLPVLLPIQILPSFSGASGDGCLQRVEILWLQNPEAVGNYWQPWNTVTILFFCNFIVNIWLSLIGKWMKVLEPDILPVLK